MGVGGPVGAGKTALVLALCEHLRDRFSLGVVTNDIFTREDAEFLNRAGAIDPARIRAVETGVGSPRPPPRVPSRPVSSPVCPALLGSLGGRPMAALDATAV